MQKLHWIVGGVVAIGVAGLLVWQPTDDSVRIVNADLHWEQQQPTAVERHAVLRDNDAVATPSAAAAQSVIEETSKAAEPQPEPINLSATDADFRAAAGQLASNLPDWLLPDEQLRKWVSTLDLAAAGKLMVKNNPVALNLGEFHVIEHQGTIFPSSENEQISLDKLRMLTEVKPGAWVNFYRDWQPALEQAWGELGLPGTFDQRLRAALARIASIEPTAYTELALKQPSVFYIYADPAREQAPALDKFFWRRGPEFTRIAAAYARELLRRLDSNSAR